MTDLSRIVAICPSADQSWTERRPAHDAARSSSQRTGATPTARDAARSSRTCRRRNARPAAKRSGRTRSTATPCGLRSATARMRVRAMAGQFGTPTAKRAALPFASSTANDPRATAPGNALPSPNAPIVSPSPDVGAASHSAPARSDPCSPPHGTNACDATESRTLSATTSLLSATAGRTPSLMDRSSAATATERRPTPRYARCTPVTTELQQQVTTDFDP